MIQQDQRGSVTLWDLLTLISFVMPIAGASAEAKLSHAGFAGYALVISIGLAIGFGCAACMRIALVRVGGYMEGKLSTQAESWYSGAMLMAGFLWIVLALFIGGWLARSVLSLLR